VSRLPMTRPLAALTNTEPNQSHSPWRMSVAPMMDWMEIDQKCEARQRLSVDGGS
jgi:hypothetical protein